METTTSDWPIAETLEPTYQAKLKALCEAAQVGWDDIAAGRYIDLEDHEIDAFLDGLGQPAAR